MEDSTETMLLTSQSKASTEASVTDGPVAHEIQQNKAPGGLIQKTSLQVEANASTIAKALSTGTSYCYPPSYYPPGTKTPCWDNKPDDAPHCNAESGNNACRCGQVNVIIGSGKDSATICNVAVDLQTGVSGHCSQVKIYFVGAHRDEAGNAVFTDSEEYYCESMLKLDQWSSAIATSPENKEAEPSWGWWDSCPSGYDHVGSPFSDDKCHREKRYLGEVCWSATSLAKSDGQCHQHDRDDAYSVSCYEGKCVSTDNVPKTKKECACASMLEGLHMYFVCTAKDDMCDGHACATATNDGKTYCDYNSKQDWNGWRNLFG